MEVRAGSGDAEAIGTRLRASWGPVVASRGQLIDPVQCSLLAAYDRETMVGVAAYDIAGDECEVVAIETFPRGLGAGPALMDRMASAARWAGCRRLWLIMTNNNTDALGFYQCWGMELVAVHLGAVDNARRALKPSIPELGHRGIPIRHELELEMLVL